MGKLLLLLSSLVLLSSCAEQFNIAGNSNVPGLDGRMLYLRLSPDRGEGATLTQSICLDSCKVIHGRFSFVGDVDSAQMAMIYTRNQYVMPLVIENGKLDIQVDNATQRVTGGPLNDKLYAFFSKRNRLDNELWELQQKTMQMMRDGKTPEAIERKVGKKMRKISEEAQALEVKFVKDNYNNVLGPGFFMMLCSQYPTPILTEQIRQIIDDAPAQFLNDPFVRHYVRAAEMRRAVSRGLEPHMQPDAPEHAAPEHGAPPMPHHPAHEQGNATHYIKN